MTTSEISFYVDTLLVEAVLANPEHFYKKGGFITDLLSKIKQYFASKIDPKHPTTSVLMNWLLVLFGFFLDLSVWAHGAY